MSIPCLLFPSEVAKIHSATGVFSSFQGGRLSGKVGLIILACQLVANRLYVQIAKCKLTSVPTSSFHVASLV